MTVIILQCVLLIIVDDDNNYLTTHYVHALGNMFIKFLDEVWIVSEMWEG